MRDRAQRLRGRRHTWLIGCAALGVVACTKPEPPPDVPEPPAAQALPQLGKSPLPEVIAALTPDEKVLLVLGAGMSMPDAPPELRGPAGVDPAQRVPGAAGQTVAVPRLGIPSIVLADGPAGLRIDPRRSSEATASFHCTAFPIASALAASWSTELVEQVGKALGAEVRGYGVDVLLAPALNLQRVPLGGRNFEYYSEDPLLSGSMAAAMVRGVQSNGVGTSIKHFVANNHEWNRNVLNVRVEERALRELYLRGFEIAVREGDPWTVMSSYNRVNGEYTSQDPRLLTTILRNEWGFRGLVMTDWFAGDDPVAQMVAGNDLLMPGKESQREALATALAERKLDPAVLDRNVQRVLELVLRSPTFRGEKPAAKVDLEAGARVARAAAAESMVLLKNERGRLPLAKAARLALFGAGSYETLIGGTGSGDVHEAYSVALSRGLSDAGFALDTTLQQRHQAHIAAENQKLPDRRGIEVMLPLRLPPEPALDAALIEQSATSNDAAVLTLRRSSGEFLDRSPEDFQVSAGEKALLERAFRARGKPVIVVLNVGGPIETASWKTQADALLLAWQPGQEAGHAIADVLAGQVNPSGKLPVTFPVALDDAPAMQGYPGTVLEPGTSTAPPPFGGAKAAEVTYSEGLAVGYRHFQTRAARVSFPFGYGLSYTAFAYGPLQVQPGSAPERWTATVEVRNAGKVAGSEVVQLYVSAPKAEQPQPTIELRRFAKTRRLEPGEAQTVSFELGPRELASFDADGAAWVARAGEYTLSAAASAADLRRSKKLRLERELRVPLEPAAR